MIYEACSVSAAIRQGDIFRGIPRIDVDLSSLPVLDSSGEPRTSSWNEELDRNISDPIPVVATARSVDAIVISQDCDASSRTYISLCEIVSVGSAAEQLSQNTDARVKQLLRFSLTSPRAFYLPADSSILGREQRTAVDFSVILRVLRKDLENLVNRRACRLNSEAYQHFREALAQYLRRYPVDAWYPLDREEFAAYLKKYPGDTPRPHQA